MKLISYKEIKNKNKGFTPTPILKKDNVLFTYQKFLSLFRYQKINSVGIGVSLRSKRGFTLVELLVTISMFVILTGVVLVNSNTFDSSVLLKNFTYDVALTIKQAQSYGVNTQENILGTFNSSGQAYGVYFDLVGSQTNFVLYNDTVDSTNNNIPDHLYNDSVTNCQTDSLECIQKYSIRKGYIKSICTGTNENDCTLVDQLSILFKRPNLNALIYSKTNGNTLPTIHSYAKITLSSVTNSASSSVVVTETGQIYVKN